HSLRLRALRASLFPYTTLFRSTIDHKKHLLENTDLVICDGQTPACVAGVMGGVESEITEKTKNVFLESAYFKSSIVRKQSKRLRSEEHTSELQSREKLVCRLLL